MTYTLYDWLMDNEELKVVVMLQHRVFLIPAIWLDNNASLPGELGQRVTKDDYLNLSLLLRIPGVEEIVDCWE